MTIHEILTWVMGISACLMILAILLQARGASLGAGFGSSGELFTTRRGIEKNLYDTTIILAIVFVASILVNLVLG